MFAKIEEPIDRLPDKTADIVEFAIYSGFRKSNIYDMKIEQIQFNTANQTMEIELEIKGGRFEVFPVCPHAASILRANIGNRKIGYVFLNPKTGKPFKDIHRAFNTAVKELGLMVNGTKLRIHDLRHIVPTWLHQQGIGDDILQQLLGHRDRKTTRPVHYAKQSSSCRSPFPYPSNQKTSARSG